MIFLYSSLDDGSFAEALAAWLIAGAQSDFSKIITGD